MPVWREQAPEAELLPALADWFQSPLGRAVLADELSLLNEALADCYGSNLLELSIAPQFCVYRCEGMRRRYCLGTPAQRLQGLRLDGECEFERLPLASDSQDVVVLHHLLEFVANPHAVLREVERVLVPHGRVVAINFNPFSLLALRMLGARARSHSVWRNHFLTSRRISDWLQLLGFAINDVHYGFHRVPLNSPGWFLRHWLPPQSRLRRMPFGAVQVLSATKYRAPLTPAKIRWSTDSLVNVRPLGAARQGCLPRQKL